MVKHAELVRATLLTEPAGLTALEVSQRCGLDSTTVRRVLRKDGRLAIDGVRRGNRGWALVWKVKG